MSSPTQRTLKELRELGWDVDIAERNIPHAKLKKDLFGFIDILGMKGDYLLAIQTTTGDHHADRDRKILASPLAPKWITEFRKLELWSWRKGLSNGRGSRLVWKLRKKLYRKTDFTNIEC